MKGAAKLGVLCQSVGNWLVWAWTGLMPAASLTAATADVPDLPRLQATPASRLEPYLFIHSFTYSLNTY